MKCSNRKNNNNQAIYEVQFIYGKKLFKNNYHYAVKWSGWPISQMSWEPLTSFTEDSCYLIRRFETRICYLFYNKKISPSQNGIRIHVKKRFCQVYIPQIINKNKSIIDQKWKLQNISNQLIQTQSIITQNIKDVSLVAQDSKLESKGIIVQFNQLPPFLGERQIKQNIVSIQSMNNFNQILKKDREIEKDIKYLISLEKAQKNKIKEQQQQVIQYCDVQNEQQDQGGQKINQNQSFNQTYNNNKLSKKNTKQSNSNEKKNENTRQQRQKIKKKSEPFNNRITKKFLSRSFDQEKKRKQDQSYGEIITIEDDCESFQVDIQSQEEVDLNEKKEVFHINVKKQKQLQKSTSLILEQSLIIAKDQQQKREKGRAVKTANFKTFQNLINQESQIQQEENKNDDDINDNQINMIQFDDYLNNSNENSHNTMSNNNENNNNNDNNNINNNNNNNINKQKFIIKSDKSQYFQSNVIKDQVNQNKIQKNVEKDDLQDQIQNQKKKENENLVDIIFKEPKQQSQIKTSQQIQQEIQKLHLDRMAQNKPSRCSVPIIPRIKDVQIQVYIIEIDQQEMIQYDSELNKVIIPKLMISTINSHQLMNEQLFFQCLYENGKEYYLQYDELKAQNPQELLDYMILNSMLI
ncbi:unnamed protein product [Paramecium sonneborni]|uniref:Chromo domain-containing protein n=1 Tax=Paramecium sonneborni TaxID=65129 RepID=A0A8S1PG52_9CILI|nr:unnamed protein product [Paramecium sonneborni]